jgi:hypothetical protein
LAKNRNLHAAKRRKDDEFYTRWGDIEVEVGNYRKYFKDKVVFLNCDDPQTSNFWKYFALNFEYFGLKKLVATHYNPEKPTYKLEATRGEGRVDYDYETKTVTGLNIVKTPLKQNGDFRSPECIEILKESDVVVTNPPFSLFREYIDQLIMYDKQFLILGSMNATTYKEVFKYIKGGRLWLGYNLTSRSKKFIIPAGVPIRTQNYTVDEQGNRYVTVQGVIWYTNLPVKRSRDDNKYTDEYYGHEEKYPKYDNYDVIEVSKVATIPGDYKGVMGVPITFLLRYDPELFEILGIANSARWIGYKCLTLLHGHKVYNRLLIRWRRKNED